MEIKVTTEQARVPVAVMHVDGNIDSATYEIFRAKAEELMRDGARHILVDLSHTAFVSSAGLRALHYIFNSLRSLQPDSLTDEEVKKGIAEGTYKSPHLKMLNPSKETRTAFELSGFDMFIETYGDRQAALASF